MFAEIDPQVYIFTIIVISLADFVTRSPYFVASRHWSSQLAYKTSSPMFINGVVIEKWWWRRRRCHLFQRHRLVLCNNLEACNSKCSRKVASPPGFRIWSHIWQHKGNEICHTIFFVIKVFKDMVFGLNFYTYIHQGNLVGGPEFFLQFP